MAEKTRIQAAIVAVGLSLFLLGGLTGCAALRDEIRPIVGDDSGSGSIADMKEAISLAVPESETTVTSHKNGFALELGVFVSVPVAAEFYEDMPEAIIEAVCGSVEQGRYDYLDLSVYAEDVESQMVIHTAYAAAHPDVTVLGDAGINVSMDDACA
jgi:hypothetical protein